MESTQYFKDILGNSNAILEEVQDNADNIQSRETETVVEICTPDFHTDECTCFEKREEEMKQMQAQLEKERQEYQMKKELRRKEREEAERKEREEVARKEREEAERVEKEKKRNELVQLEQSIKETGNAWHEKDTKRKQLEEEIKNLKKDCNTLYDKYYELAEKYNKLSGTKKYKVPDTYESDKLLKNFVNKFGNLYGDSTNYNDYYTIKPFYYTYNY